MQTTQTMIVASSLRSAWAVGEDSSAKRGAAESRDGNRPLPMSPRFARSATRARTAAAPTASASRTSAGRGRMNGSISSAQPSGVTHRSHAAPDAVSATARISSATATAPKPIHIATRRRGASWLASAPTPANTGIGAMIVNASTSEPPAGRPPTTSPAQDDERRGRARRR